MSLHRRVALRLGAGALLVSLLAGLVTLFIESERVDETILDLAERQAAAFSQRAPGVQKQENEAAVKPLLTEFLNDHNGNQVGHFLLAEIYDPDRNEVAQAHQNLPEEVEQQIDTGPHRFPKNGKPWYRKILHKDNVYLQVLTPMLTADGRPAGTFEGLYHVTPEEMRFITGRVTGTVFLVVLVVVLTAMALYPIIIHLHREQEQLSTDLLKANLDTLAVLGSAIAKRDSDTHAHNFRVSLYALGLAERCGLGPDAIRELIKGSWLHDVGKIAITDAILRKPGRLDEQEFTEMKTHVQHGLDIIGQFPWLQSAAEVVGGHHEKWDGSGYPQGLKGEEIPLNARIFALADVFDALTSRRPYKEPMSAAQALEIMAEGRGSHFDPSLFDRFAAGVIEDYEQFGGREDDLARDLLLSRGQKYFFLS